MSVDPGTRAQPAGSARFPSDGTRTPPVETDVAVPWPRFWLDAHRRWLAAQRRLVIGGSLVLWLAGNVAFIALVVVDDLDFLGPLGGPYVLGFGVFALTGAIIGWYRPGHLLALFFLVLGLAAPLANTLLAATLGPLATQPLELRTLLAALSLAATTMVFPLLPLAVVMFPDGRLPSQRWRWLPLLALLASLLGGVAALAAGTWGGEPEGQLIGAPFDGALLGVADVLSPLYFSLLPVLTGSAAVAMVLRYRRGGTVVRQQLKWLGLAALVLVLIFLWLLVTTGAAATAPGISAAVMSVGIALVPVSVAIAIVRHGLYDIDLVLSRTLVFVMLAAFITALYAVTVAGVGTLIGDPTNVVLTIGTTALVAVVFEPVRARAHRLANRAVYGRRATPYEVLTGVVDALPTGGDVVDLRAGAVPDESGSAAGSVDAAPIGPTAGPGPGPGTGSSDVQLVGLAQLLADGTGAGHTTIWVRSGDHLHAAACAPPHDPAEHAVMGCDGDGQPQIEPATHVEPVRLDGELIGALSFERSRDHPVTPHDRALLSQMGGQASLVLGNARLREQLADRVAQLRVSRQRLVAAQDEARRRLERDLHDGAQQQLVALKVKLGLARSIGAKEGVEAQLDDALGELATIADAAVGSLRDLARGIYPPLLEAEGLERALASAVQRLPIPIELHTTGLGRYDREVEATVYFSVLEAVRATAQQRQPGSLRIDLDDRSGQLNFRLVDDGGEIAERRDGLAIIIDRIDALDGELTISAGHDGGLAVVGSIPVATRRAPRPGTAAAGPDALVGV